ncbi:MAG: hypothetical protein A3G49_04960 [Candidatus Sungbacteria bacterium RIFCSPLOWO2_12_FULL_41_11]|uniref:Nucleotidyl transferase domain-containing protein n=1 Tax=Candidatus Sungbacteria bacterium RIFCSPLOWO2_12_FULL_41_11 TaxID=1802286 RepID=A0A1G2LQB0_9BACT|nr:MAG: hypothetical protein A3G49_04960 [Candidatus Sungbacteria bacterium RIFCSPLOWO2_12_FULL_41_11]
MPKKAIILAGGKGTRLHPITLEIPKPLLTVKKQPIINYLLDIFKKYGIREVKIIIKEADKEDFFWWRKRYETRFDLRSITFEVEKEPMGTLGYVYHHLRDWIGNEPFFMSNADELKEVDLAGMHDFHVENSGLATLALMKVDNPSDYGVAIMQNERITEFLEKPENPPSSFISGGLYLISPESFSRVATSGNSKFLMIEKDLFPKLAQAKLLLGYKHDGRFFDCGTFERLEKAIKFFSS